MNLQIFAVFYLFKFIKENTRTMRDIYSIKTPEQRHWDRSGVFVVNFKQISYIVLVFQFLALKKEIPAGEGLYYWI